MRIITCSLALAACAAPIALFAPIAPCAAQSARPMPLVHGVALGAGVLTPAGAGDALRLEEPAFDSGGPDLTRDAVARLAAVGRALARSGVDSLRVVIYTPPTAAVGQDRASLRAVAVARALARGGFPAGRILLEVAAPLPGEQGAGRIAAGRRCVSGCDGSAIPPPR